MTLALGKDFILIVEIYGLKSLTVLLIYYLNDYSKAAPNTDLLRFP